MHKLDKEVGKSTRKEMKKEKKASNKKRYLKAKSVLAKKEKKLIKKKKVFTTEQKMNIELNAALKTIKANANVKDIRTKFVNKMNLLAGNNKKLAEKVKEMLKKFDSEAEKKVKLIVKDLLIKIEEENEKKKCNKISKTLAKKAIEYINQSNMRMSDAKKYLELSCKAHPLYCQFFKKSFICIKYSLSYKLFN